ncbi:MAG: UDP-2,3-diacylglucosamine hydrolase [Alphaproteobacteria bacterium CG_4_10_14_0_2_um_filter_63_37]|nr:MAG: UDP-2,3-diacylglucosamine hydrolase [Alphaproteobacteria bacterium CG_4_10_14_0_2_um_filter_63_37]
MGFHSSESKSFHREETVISAQPKQRFRTIWLSDVHLGFRGCRADFLHDFLKKTHAETIYLVGDIVDLWEMKRRLYWPQPHNNVIRTLLGKAKRGTKIVYIPGNHDELLRDHAGLVFGNVELREQAIHTTADGRRFLILHGDEFDSVVKCSPWLAKLGNRAYDWLLYLNRWFNVARRKMGFSYWSLSAYIKGRVKNAVQYVSSFEGAVARAATQQGVDGVICGHIHRAEIRKIEGILYCNLGDWVESCTALVERPDGYLELIHWSDETMALKGEEGPAVAVEVEVAA